MEEAKKHFLGGSNGIFGNIPTEKIFTVDGKHAMISINEKISHMLANGFEISWMEDACVDEDRKPIIDCRGPNGSPAGEKILKKLKECNRNRKVKTAYAYLRFWSDSFLKCWTKQRENSILMLAVTFPNFNKNATSEYHTQVLAIGRSHDDHTPVIAYNFNELKKNCKGVL